MLFNSGAWHGLTNVHIVKLESVDQALLRGIWKSRSKTAKEFLHFENGTIPLTWIIAQRSLNYLKHIVGRPDSEIIKKECFLLKRSNHQKVILLNCFYKIAFLCVMTKIHKKTLKIIKSPTKV